MRLTLEIPAAPDGPQAYTIEPGTEVRFGRSAPSEIVLAWDPALSRRHFAVTFDGETGQLRDLGSTHGTIVNETQADETAIGLKDGDQIIAGGTIFRVHLRATGEAIASESEPIPPAVAVLRGLEEPLFAVLDAARDPLVLGLLMQSAERYQSLYEGPKAQRYATIAPYLTALPKDSPFLVELIQKGWGKSWGIFLTCDRPFEEVRKHLRRFLTVEMEGPPARGVLFRYYDPRVMRLYLPTCLGDELPGFFGPIGRMLMESRNPDVLLDFRVDADRLNPSEIMLVSNTSRTSAGIDADTFANRAGEPIP